MKIVSWNVNGIKAALSHGIKPVLQEMQADVYLFQETRADRIIKAAEFKSYYPYWNSCRNRKGYSGVMCMSREEPLSVSFSIGNDAYDKDGRVMTLEFQDFFLVNCYCPTAVYDFERKDYREYFDEVFYRYLLDLKLTKEVIICGDFNVAYGPLDICAGDMQLQAEVTNYKESEKANMSVLFRNGYVDSFRYLYPRVSEHFTWWSPRNGSRKYNRGERIDYAIVSEGLKEKIVDSRTLMGVMGSDHCPIQLEINIPLVGTSRTAGEHRRFRLDEEDRFRAIVDSPFGIINLGDHWTRFDWEYAESYLALQQRRLSRAAAERNWRAMEKLQDEITGSIYSKALAVRKVCGTRSTPGVDRVVWSTPRERMEAAISLTPEKYTALPDKLVLMRSRSDKVRRIHIGTWYDRAMQTLFSYALDPIAESWGDRMSFAYRKGRCQADAVEYVREAFSGDNGPRYAFVGDIRQCYESISHDWILSHIPIRQDILRKFIESGFVFGGEEYESPDDGIGIGCSISPIIANMTLDGLSKVVEDALRYTSSGEGHRTGEVIRFADDFIVPLSCPEDGETVRKEVSAFLSARGLSLSPEKTRVVDVKEGFDFTKKHFRYSDGYVFVTPSSKAVENFKFGIMEVIANFTGTQKDFIRKINQKISGWANQYRMYDSEKVFRELDVAVSSLLLDMVVKKHPRWSLEKIVGRYFYQGYGDVRYFSLPNNKEIRVNRLSDYVFYKHSRVNVSKNPYVDRDYFEWRTDRRDERTMAGKCRQIWENQQGRCFYCGEPVLIDQECILKDVCVGNLGEPVKVYIHRKCEERSIEYIDVDVLPDSEREVSEILKRIVDGKACRDFYHPLADYFHTSRASLIRLTFKDIEDIMGAPLPPAADKTPFWTRTGFNNISQSWLCEGYEIRKLDIQKKTVSFYRVSSRSTALNIPDVFLSGHIPDKPKYELEKFFKYIIDKYGLKT